MAKQALPTTFDALSEEHSELSHRHRGSLSLDEESRELFLRKIKDLLHIMRMQYEDLLALDEETVHGLLSAQNYVREAEKFIGFIPWAILTPKAKQMLQEKLLNELSELTFKKPSAIDQK